MRQAIVAIILMIAATGAGIAAASVVLKPSERFDRQPDWLMPGPAEMLIGARIPGTGGEPGWAVRTYMSRAGLLCVERGRLAAGIFGDLDDTGALVPRPPGPTGSCGDVANDPVLAAVDRIAAGGPTTVVYGASGKPLRSATVAVAGDEPTRLRVGSRGSFIGVFRGLIPPRSVRLRVEFADGESHIVTWDDVR